MSKTRLWIVTLLVVALASTMVLAAGKTYQVTGPVLEVTNDKIVVQKGSDKWEIARDAATKVTGDLVVGAKVTIQYTMTATAIEVKPATQKSGTASKPKH